jgi:hypothetical protein
MGHALQWVCFPIYGISRVQRHRYFAIDRHKLAYLNVIEKANCVYCSYANGLIGYVREVTARTEQTGVRFGTRVPYPTRTATVSCSSLRAGGYRRCVPSLRKQLRS